MSYHQIEEKLKKIFLDKLHLEVPSCDADLIELGLMDSLKLVDLLLHLENDFGVSFTAVNIEIDHFRSIEKIAGLLSQQLAIKAAV